MVDQERPSRAQQMLEPILQLFETMGEKQAERLHGMAERTQDDLPTEQREWFRISQSAMWWHAYYRAALFEELGSRKIKRLEERSAAAWTIMVSILKYCYALGVRRGMRVQVAQQERVKEANRIASEELVAMKENDDQESDETISATS